MLLLNNEDRSVGHFDKSSTASQYSPFREQQQKSPPKITTLRGDCTAGGARLSADGSLLSTQSANFPALANGCQTGKSL